MGLLENYLNKKKGTPENDGKGGGILGAVLPSYHKGGIVKKTGPAVLKKGERVLTKKQQKRCMGK